MGAALVSFAPSRLPATQVESIPVNIVTDTATSEMTKGMTTAPKESKKQFVEKIDQPQAVDNPAAKIAPKEVTASTDATPPPAPPEPKREETKKKAEPKRDLIADALKKDEAKKSEQKKADAKIPTPPKRPPTPQAKPQPKFDPREMAALIDRRDPQRKQATGDTLSDAPALGTARGSARQLTQNEMRCAHGSRNCGIRRLVRRTRRNSWSRFACASIPTARSRPRRRSRPPGRVRYSWRRATALFARSSAASRSICSGPKPMNCGKTSRSRSIRAT
jgi:outer membrane biosynthesis protein TonB